MYKIQAENTLHYFKKFETPETLVYECNNPPCYKNIFKFGKSVEEFKISAKCLNHINSDHPDIAVALNHNKQLNESKRPKKLALSIEPTNATGSFPYEMVSKQNYSITNINKSKCETNTLSDDVQIVDITDHDIEQIIDKSKISKKSQSSVISISENPQPKAIRLNTKNIESLILEFFIGNLRPISMIDDNLFKNMFQPMFDAVWPITKKTLTEKIGCCANSMVNKIKKSISSSIINIKIDVLIESRLIIMAMHAQMPINNEIFTVTLSVNTIPLEIDYAELKKIIELTLKKYHIQINQILTLSTDIKTQGLSVKEPAVESLLYGFKIVCDNIFPTDIVRIEPAMRIIQTCISKVMQNSELTLCLQRCRQLIHKHNKEYPQKKTLPLDMTYDWVSTVTMVENLLATALTYLTTNEVNYLNSFISIFQIVQKTCAKLKGTNLIFSDQYILLMELKLTLTRSKSPLSNIFVEALNIWHSTTFLKEPICLSSIYLDPRIRICLNDTQIDSVKTYLKKIYTTTFNKQIGNDLFNISDVSSNHTVNHNSAKTTGYKSIFYEYLETLPSSSNQIECTLDYEFSRYEFEVKERFPIDSNILEFWALQNNLLAEMAKVVMTIPITQNTADRNSTVFDFLISNGSTTNLKDVENILLIKFNCSTPYECN